MKNKITNYQEMFYQILKNIEYNLSESFKADKKYNKSSLKTFEINKLINSIKSNKMKDYFAKEINGKKCIKIFIYSKLNVYNIFCIMYSVVMNDCDLVLIKRSRKDKYILDMLLSVLCRFAKQFNIPSKVFLSQTLPQNQSYDFKADIKCEKIQVLVCETKKTYDFSSKY